MMVESEGKRKISFNLLMLIFFIILSSCIFGASCTNHLQCPSGQICDENSRECRECITSAECWSKTLLKSTPAGGVSPWFSISVIILLIALTGVGIFYMVAYLFQSEQYKKIAFAELMQVLASFLLVGLLFGFEIFETDLLTRLESSSGTLTAVLMNSFTGMGQTSFTGQVQISPFDVSYSFLKKMVDCAVNQLKTTYENSKTIQTIIDFNMQVTVILPGSVRVSPPNPLQFTNLAETAAKYEFNANELTWLIIFLYAQIAVLKFIETSMFTVFLPIGLILRAFPPTRGAGAVLMAIAIGFYLIYPLTYVLLYVGTPPNIEGCNVQPSFDTTATQKICPVSIGAVSQLVASASDISTTLDTSIPKIQAGINSLKFIAFIYMLISLGVTFIFIRSLSSILGADISEIGRTMLRML